MRCSKALPLSLLTLALISFLALPASAQPTILKGVDLFETSASGGTLADFSSDPIPAGFFCTGSAAFGGTIKLVGVPLTTVPAGIAANADTAIERTTDGVFAGGAASIQVIVRALQLAGQSNLTITCGSGATTTWNVRVCLCGTQSTTKVVAKVDQSCGCGHFSGSLKLRVCFTFTNVATGQVLGPISRTISLGIDNTSWCPSPGADTPVIKTAFAVDANCDGCSDTLLPANSNFFPNWDCSTKTSDCWTQYAALTECHSSFGTAPHDHCTNPICGRKQ